MVADPLVRGRCLGKDRAKTRPRRYRYPLRYQRRRQHARRACDFENGFATKGPIYRSSESLKRWTTTCDGCGVVWLLIGCAAPARFNRGSPHTEAESNPRLCVIQLFGSDSAFVVTHTVSVIGVCDLFLIPEVPFIRDALIDTSMQRSVEDIVKKRYSRDRARDDSHGLRRQSPMTLTVFRRTRSRTHAEREGENRIFSKTGRVFGQTPDELRSGGSKLTSGLSRNSSKRTMMVFSGTLLERLSSVHQ